MENNGKTSVYVDRPLYVQEELHIASKYEKPKKSRKFCILLQ